MIKGHPNEGLIFYNYIFSSYTIGRIILTLNIERVSQTLYLCLAPRFEVGGGLRGRVKFFEIIEGLGGMGGGVQPPGEGGGIDIYFAIY